MVSHVRACVCVRCALSEKPALAKQHRPNKSRRAPSLHITPTPCCLCLVWFSRVSPLCQSYPFVCRKAKGILRASMRAMRHPSLQSKHTDTTQTAPQPPANANTRAAETNHIHLCLTTQACVPPQQPGFFPQYSRRGAVCVSHVSRLKDHHQSPPLAFFLCCCVCT
jgi:hypothetical protein